MTGPGHEGGRPRLRDVAALAGVDQSLVSRVLRDDASLRVKPETRERILRAASELDYRPNLSARTLRTARSMTIGMVVPTLSNAVYPAIAAGADERARESGYALVLAAGGLADTAASLAGRVDGLLVAVATSESPDDTLRRSGVDAVLINRHESAGVPSVTVDDHAGARLATNHLLGLGHRRIAHIAGPQNVDTARRRLAGYVEALREAGIEEDRELVVETSYDEAGGYQAAAQLAAMPDRATAIFAANVQAAVGAMAALRRHGLTIPGDMSIVAFHDATIAAYTDPPLTTVRMPLAQMGRQAVEMLLQRFAGDTPVSTQVAIPAALTIRESTGAPR